jgi:elongation factor P
MITASEVKSGAALKLEDNLFRILEAVHHSGTGQMASFVLLKLQDIRTHHFTERRLKPTDRLEEVTLARRGMEYIYRDDDSFYFMDSETYEQYGMSKASIGGIERFLKEGMKVVVEMLGEEALALQFPKAVELKVTLTTQGIRGEQENTLRLATLENGIEVLVPQFVEVGETVRLDTEKGKYIERVATKKV